MTSPMLNSPRGWAATSDSDAAAQLSHLKTGLKASVADRDWLQVLFVPRVRRCSDSSLSVCCTSAATQLPLNNHRTC
jgi:hypothetical protein